MASAFRDFSPWYALAWFGIVLAVILSYQGHQPHRERNTWHVLSDAVLLAGIGMDGAFSHYLAAVDLDFKDVALDARLCPPLIPKLAHLIRHAVIEVCAVGPSACD